MYRVAVYFRGRRLAVGNGHSIQEAEMSAATNALAKSKNLFPQLNHQKKVIEKSIKKKRKPSSSNASTSSGGQPSGHHHEAKGRDKDKERSQSNDKSQNSSGKSSERSSPREQSSLEDEKQNRVLSEPMETATDSPSAT